MCARLKKGAGKKNIVTRPETDSSDHRDTGGIFPGAWKSPEEIRGNPFLVGQIVPRHRTENRTAAHTGLSPPNVDPANVCQRSIPREYVDPVLINQARGTDSLPVHYRCHRRRSCNSLFVRVIVTRF